MRVLDTRTGQFVEFADLDQVVGYAILSHTWDPKGEQSFQELCDIQVSYTRGMRAMAFCSREVVEC